MCAIVNMYEDDTKAVLDWCEEIYQNKFAIFFDKVRQLYQKFQDKSKPITDDELEEIMTSLPLELFSVSENLNNLRASCEVVKLKRKEKRSKSYMQSSARNDVGRSADADASVVEDDILLLAFSTIIQRVENEISFCRELIMGAKKVYDRRKATESASPINPPTGTASKHDLPDYSAQTYIK